MGFRLSMGLGKAAVLCVASASLGAAPVVAQRTAPDWKQYSHQVFKQLIETNTADSVGSTTDAANKMRQRFLDAGFDPQDVVVLEAAPKRGNLIVRYRAEAASAQKPVLFLCHLDVVEAKRSDWSVDPFTFTERDGYYYGRGTQDIKEGDAALVTDFIRLKREGFKPKRDMILALTSDEEGGPNNGVDWLLKNHRDLIDAAYAINPDAGSVNVDHGKVVSVGIQTAEKLYGDFVLKATNRGGHSSLPRSDNAIYELAAALEKIQRYRFPFELNPATRSYLQTLATTEQGQEAADLRAVTGANPSQADIDRLSQNPELNSLVRTTCVATELSGGHAPNALPQTATANINCRILPGHSLREVEDQLVKIIADPQITVTFDNGGLTGNDLDAKSPQAREVDPAVMTAVKRIAAEMWPGAPVVATMDAGASDGKYTNAAGISTYGVSPFPIDVNDVRAHGRDERIPITSFDQGVTFYYEMIPMLAGAK